MSLLLDIGGQKYFLDFANIETVLGSGNGVFKGGMVTETDTKTQYGADGVELSKEVSTREYYRGKEIDSFRLDVIHAMIEILLTQDENEDIPTSFEKQSISFKLAFNTLVEYGILNITE